MDHLVIRGSRTARNGFRNEHDIANKFNTWESDDDAREWLMIMNYPLDSIESVTATVLHGYKADLKVEIKTKLKSEADTETIQVKLVSNRKGFNQVDKRWLKSYDEIWNFPPHVHKLLQYFTGELKPYRSNTRDGRRMFLDEMTDEESDAIIQWFCDNQMLVLTDILRGRGEFAAEWVLVAQKTDGSARWALKNIDEVLLHYSQGSVCMSPRGSITLGRVGIQRKGGDNGRETANMLQFKVDPTDLFDI